MSMKLVNQHLLIAKPVMVMFQHFHNTNFNPRTSNKFVLFTLISKVIAINTFHNFLMNRRVDVSTIFIDKEIMSLLRLVRLLLLSVFQDTQKQKKYQLCMNTRSISGIDLLKCL